jgi:hypothetical protein
MKLLKKILIKIKKEAKNYNNKWYILKKAFLLMLFLYNNIKKINFFKQID